MGYFMSSQGSSGEDGSQDSYELKRVTAVEACTCYAQGYKDAIQLLRHRAMFKKVTFTSPMLL